MRVGARQGRRSATAIGLGVLLAAAPAAAGLRLETLRFFDPNPAPSPVVGFRLHIGADADHMSSSVDIGMPPALDGGVRSHPLLVDASARVYLALSAYDGAGRESARSNAVMREARRPAFDHDADGRSDLLRIETASGGVEVLPGGRAATPLPLPSPGPPGSSIVARGDFDGSGTSDILWQQRGSRALVLWLLDPDGNVHPVDLPTPQAQVRVLGASDLDGDSRDDIVLEDPTNGDLQLWRMVQPAAPQTGVLAGLPPPWRVVDVGDVDGDRFGDVVWWNPAEGEIAVWHLYGERLLEETLVLGRLPGDARPIGLGDYDGDGAADLAVRIESVGAIAYTSLREGAVSLELLATVRRPGVEVAAGHDLDGDGQADLVFVDVSSRSVDAQLSGSGNATPRLADFGASSLSDDVARAIGDSDNDWQPDHCDADFDNDRVVTLRDLRRFLGCLLRPAQGDCASVAAVVDRLGVTVATRMVNSRFGEPACAELAPMPRGRASGSVPAAAQHRRKRAK